MLVRWLAEFVIVALLFNSSTLAAEHAREDAIRFCKDYVQEGPATEKCINDQLATSASTMPPILLHIRHSLLCERRFQ